MKKDATLALCYRFSFDLEAMALSIRIQKWIVPAICEHLQCDTMLMKYLFKTYGGDKSIFSSFGKSGQSFGYEDAMRWHSETDREIVYSYAFQPMLEITDKECEECGGSGINVFRSACFACRETGKEHVETGNHFLGALLSMYPIVRIANLALLEEALGKKEYSWNPQTNESQSVALEWSDTSGMHNCSMVGWISNDVFDWVQEMPDSAAGHIVDCMSRVESLLRLTKPDRHSYRFAQYQHGGIDFQVPGNACALGTCSHGMGMFGSLGKTLQPHNVDTRFQQLGFIVGMAALNDLFEHRAIAPA